MRKAPRWRGSTLVGDVVRDRLPLWVTCKGCEHRARLDPAKVAERLGYDMPLPDLRRKFKCTRCGARGAAEVSVGHYPQGAGR
jgi:hypothetical protein